MSPIELSKLTLVILFFVDSLFLVLFLVKPYAKPYYRINLFIKQHQMLIKFNISWFSQHTSDF